MFIINSELWCSLAIMQDLRHRWHRILTVGLKYGIIITQCVHALCNFSKEFYIGDRIVYLWATIICFICMVWDTMYVIIIVLWILTCLAAFVVWRPLWRPFERYPEVLFHMLPTPNVVGHIAVAFDVRAGQNATNLSVVEEGLPAKCNRKRSIFKTLVLNTINHCILLLALMPNVP